MKVILSLAVLTILVIVASLFIDFRKNNQESPVQTVEAALAEWEKATAGDLSSRPCDARLRRNNFRTVFGKYWESASDIDGALKARLFEKHLDQEQEYALAAARAKRQDERLECNDLPERVLLREALEMSHLPEDEPVLRSAYIEALREEIDQLRKEDFAGPLTPPPFKSEIMKVVEGLIEEALSLGISREELGR